MKRQKKGLLGGKKGLAPTQTIALVFSGLILLGALLLMLPVSTRDGQGCDFLSALFTATSATCVTGLVMFDTWTQWSGFGQVVIISLIEIGGLGFMSAASLVVFLLRRRVGLKQKMVMAQALSVSDMEGVVRLQKMVLVGSILVQLTGAAILTAHFWGQYGAADAIRWGCFHSISAFCNAGFDIFGKLNIGGSLLGFRSDPVVLLTLGTLVVVGGLGFFVWEEVIRLHSWKKFSVYTKLVLLASTALLLGGAAGFCLLEWNNPETLGLLSVRDKLVNGLFQSITVRTAGFDAINQGGLTDAGKALSILLMFVGGASGSTAGGVKIVTVLVLLMFIWNRSRGRDTVCVFKRTIPGTQVMDALTIATIVALLAVFGGLFISATSPIGFTDGLYESVSALATVGLTTGVTTSLSFAAKILIIVYMYFGRVGVLTLSLGFLMGDRAEQRFRYASTSLLIG